MDSTVTSPATDIRSGTRAVLLDMARCMVARTAFVADGRDAIDWDALLDLARAHRLVELCGRLMDSLPPDIVLAPVRGRWMSERLLFAASALSAVQELSRVLRVLTDARVHALAYKGPALSLAAYGDVGARVCTDLDLVVSPHEFARARTALVSAGYRSRPGMSRGQEAVLCFGQGHAEYARAATPAPFVELHWRFVAQRLPWSPDVSDVLARSVPLQVGGVGASVPSDADHVLLLSMHGTRHHWTQLEWLVSLSAFLRRDFDGEAVLERATRIGARRALLVGTALADTLLHAAAPAALARAAASDAVVRGTVAAFAKALTVGAPGRPVADVGERTLLHRRRDVARRFAARLFLPTRREWELVRLPTILAPLYVPLRLLRLGTRPALLGEDA